jgi:hypothetical protein
MRALLPDLKVDFSINSGPWGDSRKSKITSVTTPGGYMEIGVHFGGRDLPQEEEEEAPCDL